ncbi:hypothetical protein M758_10G158500 [Ceratodon purpureus]|nr:hypothetical protein M758_10G158500 [Ceratodon purpureus]
MRTSLVQRAQEGETFHEVVINNSVGDFLASEASMFEDFAALARENVQTFLRGKTGTFPVADLVIIDQPFETCVAGFGDGIPAWNSLDGSIRNWYSSRFEFCNDYLHDDGAILILMPMGLSHEILHWILKYKLKTKCEWQVHQSEPLAHPAYEGMMVSQSLHPCAAIS